MRTLLCFALVLVACGGTGVEANTDPRCVTLCENKEQGTGTGIVCTDESVDECRSSCAAKIYGVSTLCGNCLLEGADFYAGLGGTESCTSNGTQTTCMSTVNGVQCSYDPDVPSQEKACLAKQYPDGTARCRTSFDHDLKDCTAYCTGA